MSDKPEDSRSIEDNLREIHDEKNKGLTKPKVYRGKPINVGVHHARISAIFSEGGPQGLQVQVVFLDDKNRAMTCRAKWSEPGWKFLEGDIADYADGLPGLEDLITRLRGDRFK